jgi:cell division transport system ATP-binding protein
VLVAGKNVSRLTRRSIPYLRRSVGLVFQNFRLLQDRTVFDNVALALRVMGVGREEMRLRVTRALRDAGLLAKAHLLPRSLSGGEQQRVCIARALVKEPPVLLADEPTGDLDDALAWEIFGLFKEVNARGTTVLVATHRQDLVAQVKRRAITLEHGHLVSDTGR